MLAARGQRDVEAVGGDPGVVEEQFEEVAHPVEEQRPSASAFSARYCAIIGVAAPSDLVCVATREDRGSRGPAEPQSAGGGVQGFDLPPSPLKP